MSTRYLRKVYGNDLPLKQNDGDSSDTDVPITRGKKSQNSNAFNLLIDDDSEGEKEENGEVKVQSVNHQDSTDDETAVKRKKKRKKKKKQHDKNKYQETQKKESDNDELIDEVERSVREVNRLLGEPIPSSSKENNDEPIIKSKELILNVQHKYLNPQNELKRICGNKVVERHVNKNRNRGGRTGTFRKTLLTSMNDWIPGRKTGLSMTIDDKNKDKTNDNEQYFVFVHSTGYQQIQKKFYAAVESQTPENIVNILNAYPRHVDALLQCADICKSNEELQMSAEFVERSVHCLECAFHPSFNITSGFCRLNYKHQTNRALFIALFRHLMFIAGRACYRTSLELSKVLFSLDPSEDPTAIILAIDLFALRSREYNWFIEFCNVWETEKNLSQLPNIAYSLALANFHIGKHDKADELLQHALFMFPGVLVDLLDHCGVSTDTRLLGHNYFNSQAATTTPPALEKLQDLYVIRTFHLWKEADILPWIERNVHHVMDRIDNGDELVQFCVDKRKKRYQGLPVNILRHIILSDIKEITISHSGLRSEGTFFSYDPLPPTDSIDIYPSVTRISRPTHSNRNFWEELFAPLFADLGGSFNGLNVNDRNNLERLDDEDDEEDYRNID